jgi:acyl-CoA synthetase (AMP-forming)/AMP-acid ligase II
MELSLPAICDALAAAYPERECLLFRDRRFTWAEVADRTRRLAAVLHGHDLGIHGALADCDGSESPHDHVALYLLNGNEYLEGMLGSYRARTAPVNINYRYVAEELAYVLNDAGAKAVVYHGRYADTLAEVLPRVPSLRLLLRVDDGSGDALLPGALDYEAALAAADPTAGPSAWSPDDLYIVYTGGTTGYPKGVLWRQADFLVACTGMRRPDGSDFESVEEVVARAARGDRLRTLPAPPLMHGAAHWNAISTWCSGGTIVIQDQVDRLDPGDILDRVEQLEVTSLLIVGDAFARPVIDEQRRAPRDLSSLRFVISGGAILSAATKVELHDLVPDLQIIDVLGSSESGRQGTARTSSHDGAKGTFAREDSAAVLSQDLTHVLEPGSDEVGWIAQGGRVPRGYLGDPAKTARTFPVVAGERYSVPGDRARLLADGTIELLGRDSVTINSGGEKIFAEEVEDALKHHEAVYDVLVVGRPSERWGQEVVAVVRLRDGASASDEELGAAAGRRLARYKLPKAYVRVDQIVRSPSGKPDYAWARTIAEGAASATG